MASASALAYGSSSDNAILVGCKISGWVIPQPDFVDGSAQPLNFLYHGGDEIQYDIGFRPSCQRVGFMRLLFHPIILRHWPDKGIHASPAQTQ
jgi:hypothetical protein